MIYFYIISFIILGLYYNYYIKPRNNYISKRELIKEFILIYMFLTPLFLFTRGVSMTIYHNLYPCEDCKYIKRIESYYDKNMELKTNVTYVWDHCDYISEHFYK